MGSMATEALPKKLRNELQWNESVHDSVNMPIGWGFYIIEDVAWFLVGWWVAGLVVVVTALTLIWCAFMHDVQGGTGIGQYCLAVLAILIAVVVSRSRPTKA